MVYDLGHYHCTLDVSQVLRSPLNVSIIILWLKVPILCWLTRPSLYRLSSNMDLLLSKSSKFVLHFLLFCPVQVLIDCI